MESFETQLPHSSEREPHLPVITTEERRFVEETGGDYEGYVRFDDGKERYEYFRIDRRAHYDENRHTVVETYIATELIDGDGENEMPGPDDTAGFSIMLSRLSRSGEELDRPQILMVHSTEFKNKRMTIPELIRLMNKVHENAASNSSSLDHQHVTAIVKAFLKSAGWNSNR